MADDSELEARVLAASRGDREAWREMWEELEPWLDRVVANPRFLGRVGQREDDRRNIVVEVMARLHADGHRRLVLWVEARRTSPHLRFRTWLRVVAKRVGIDYLRGHQNYVDRRRDPDRGSTPGEWIEAGELPPSRELAGERPPVTSRGTALEMLRFAAASLPEPQLSALELWTQSASFADIARELALAGGEAEAERLVRGALERLRRHFREAPPA